MTPRNGDAQIPTFKCAVSSAPKSNLPPTARARTCKINASCPISEAARHPRSGQFPMWPSGRAKTPRPTRVAHMRVLQVTVRTQKRAKLFCAVLAACGWMLLMRGVYLAVSAATSCPTVSSHTRTRSPRSRAKATIDSVYILVGVHFRPVCVSYIVMKTTNSPTPPNWKSCASGGLGPPPREEANACLRTAPARRRSRISIRSRAMARPQNPRVNTSAKAHS